MLLPHHQDMLTAGSGIAQAVIEKRGYFSITGPKQAQELGFSSKQSFVVSEAFPAMVIPYFAPGAGSPTTYVLRPDNPRSIDNKDKKKLPDGTYPQRVLKYEMIKGSGNVLDCHPSLNGELSDPSYTLIFTEGAKKADSLISRGFAAINLNGVWGWRGTNASQGKTALSDFDAIALNGRRAVLLFDSDVRTNDHVKGALRRFKNFLETRGASVISVLLPPSDNGKLGIDDWFAAGHTAQELEQLITYFEVFGPDLGPAAKKWDTESIIDWFRDCRYWFSINDMNEAKYLNNVRFDDTMRNIIEARMRDDGLPIGHSWNAAHVLGNANRFHPVKDYLENLQWNGNENIAALADYISDEDGAFGMFLRRWLIGAVAKVLGAKAQNFVLVLSGGQGIGKSNFVRFLCPPSLQKEHFTESEINPEDKDCKIEQLSRWIWEVGELGSITRRRDREALKRFFTTEQHTVRVPYAKEPITKPVVSSYMATVNPDGAGFLDDPTGSRRFAVVNLTGIDWDYTAVSIDQVWAEAVAAFKAKESFNLTKDERAKQRELNEQHEVENPFVSLVTSRFTIDASQTGDGWIMSIPSIMKILDIDSTVKSKEMALATALKTLGLQRDKSLRTVNGERARFWTGIKAKPWTP